MAKGRKRIWTFILGGLLMWGLLASPVWAADADVAKLIQLLRSKNIVTQQEADALMAEISAERKQDREQMKKEVVEEAKKHASLLSLNNKLKIDGRIYAGYLDREKKGSTFEIPDGAIRFTWSLADNVDVVTRWRYNDAKDNGLDQMYVRFKKLLPFDETSYFSIGKFKMDVGEEHKTDNRVGNWVGLISNSVVNMAATDWGAELAGSFVPKKAGYVLTVSNANNGDVADNNYKKAYSGKVYFQPIKQLYFSGGYYMTENMDGESAAMSIGGNRRTLSTTTVQDWKRSVWKVVARWEPISALRFGAAYGQFKDEAKKVTKKTDDIEGDFYYIEGRYNIIPEFYVAARYSNIELDDSAVADLAGFKKINEAERISIGAGYQINKNVTLKTEYTWNEGKAPSKSKESADQFAVGVAIAF